MMKYTLDTFTLLFLAIFIFSCSSGSQSTNEDPETNKASEQPAIAQRASFSLDEDFGNYWYAGKAELTGYALQQSRYGEVHEGEAVLIFVTEPFSKSKQVKLDNAGSAGEDAVSVLKLNFTKKFLTGIYPYSLMTSVFTPVKASENPHTLKVSTTSQEWCGHTFMQLNRTQSGFDTRLYSYFESEGDKRGSIGEVLLEDEIWTRLRLDPESIPTGRISLMPSSMYLRLLHRPIEPVEAEITREMAEMDGNSYASLRVYYPTHGRELKIYYQTEFPHVIEGWDETYQAPSWTGNAENLITKGRRLKTYRSPYWSQHGRDERYLRAELGLEAE